MKKRTKIVATISDKISSPEFLSQLFEEGVNVIRLNTAHQSKEETKKIIDTVYALNPRIGILIDTKGPEVRTSSFGEAFSVKKGETIKVAGDVQGKSREGFLYVNYTHFVKDVAIGDRILIDDGDIAMCVTAKEENALICSIENEGIIKLRKGVNVPNVKLNLPVLSEKDKDYISFAMAHKVDFIAHSFVQKADDVHEIRELLNANGSHIKIIAKIENQIGVDNIDEIIEAADGIMVARGDLGIEIPAERIPVIQRELIKKCKRNNKTVIVATQMLHSMILNPRPTRAEVNDVATAVYEKADALMLSGETATGLYPVETVKLMSKVIVEVERAIEKNPIKIKPICDDVLSVLSHSAVLACNTLPIKAIIVDTQSGRTANFLAAYRGQVPVYAFCYNEYAMRQLSLTYGVKAYMIPVNPSRDRFLKNTIEFLLAQHTLNCADWVVVVGGSFGSANGASFIEISTVQNLIDYAE
ncbi:MAG: pyruvate kinase [Bacteroidales bacterium]|nr:pyruvate kinase [Bacteroidales bacterium]